jgi:hypothetical protein
MLNDFQNVKPPFKNQLMLQKKGYRSPKLNFFYPRIVTQNKNSTPTFKTCIKLQFLSKMAPKFNKLGFVLFFRFADDNANLSLIFDDHLQFQSPLVLYLLSGLRSLILFHKLCWKLC